MGLVFDEEIMWFDVLLVAKKPISLIGTQLRDVVYRKCAMPFTDPCGEGIPFRASLEPPQLFGAESFCLIQKLVDLGASIPSRCIFLKKKTGHSPAGTIGTSSTTLNLNPV